MIPMPPIGKHLLTETGYTRSFRYQYLLEILRYELLPCSHFHIAKIRNVKPQPHPQNSLLLAGNQQEVRIEFTEQPNIPITN